MCIIKASQTLILKRYISYIVDFVYFELVEYPYRAYFGALLTDMILQTSLNYNTTVFPRVLSLIKTFTKVEILEDFVELIELYGIEDILQWHNVEKLDSYGKVNQSF